MRLEVLRKRFECFNMTVIAIMRNKRYVYHIHRSKPLSLKGVAKFRSIDECAAWLHGFLDGWTARDIHPKSVFDPPKS